MSAACNHRRPGATLIEVLIAIFVMCIGLLCVLTLFVLGAQRMSAAFKDDACARAVINARALAQIKGLRDDSNVTAKFSNSDTATPSMLPSDPVFVDSIGLGRSSVKGKIPGTTIKRVAPSYAPELSPSVPTYFTLTDDVNFLKGSGVPRSSNGFIEREARYSWAYMLQRDRKDEPASTTAQVCVFYKRPTGGVLETAYPGSILNPSDNSILLPVASDQVGVVPGNWVLDVTTGKDSTNQPNKFAFGNFYRISGVRDSAGLTRLELQNPLKGYTAVEPAGTVVLLDGLVEVFDIGYGTK